MRTLQISVTEASRNFSDCIHKAHYEGTSFLLVKNGTRMARIEPDRKAATHGGDLADDVARVLTAPPLTGEDATSWLYEMERNRTVARA